jgi:hypothetical protein
MEGRDGEPLEWWAHQDLNLEPTDYESAALTVELWALQQLTLPICLSVT